MAGLDWFVITLYFGITLSIAFYFARRSGKNTESFFLSGRNLPWWIAGTAMVATTFAADTPLAVTELVSDKGISGNWLWWNMVAGNIFTVFFFARLWRRSGVVTDVEFIELRYSGASASFLRGFKAVYLGLFMNAVIMGWVNLALAKILMIVFGASETSVLIYVFCAMAVVGVYSALTGLRGISYADVFQFITAMAGCVILAFVLLDIPEVGGVQGLKSSLPPETFNFFPAIGSSGGAAAAGVMGLSVLAFVAYAGVQWWASWYPGAEPGGGGYIAQRMLASRSERDSVISMLWFSIAHFALRPWPWIIAALAVLVLYPDMKGADSGGAYILAMKEHLPSGLLGLLTAAFLAAYMSTISTHLNWGSSYLVNDLYRRFIKTEAPEKHYVLISRLTILVLMVVSSSMILVMSTVSGAWAFLIECGAGLGLVLILRWYWWRINAWSEIAAMIAPFAGYSISFFIIGLEFPVSLFFIVSFTTVVWLVVTFITKPVDSSKLEHFFDKIRPGGPGWKPFLKSEKRASGFRSLFVDWAAGVILVYTALFGTGKLIFAEYLQAALLLTVSVASFAFVSVRLNKNEF